MATAAHIRFAKDESGRITAANDTFAVTRSAFHCLACNEPLVLRRGRGNAGPYFIHAQAAECRLGPQLALRAAALTVLTDSRFIKTPSLPRVSAGASQRRPPTGCALEQWAVSVADHVVEQVPVDFVAETLAGQLIIQISIPGLLDTQIRDKIRALELPALEVVLAKPATIHGMADLKELLLHSITNKRWLFHPAMSDGRALLEKKLNWPAPQRTAALRQTAASATKHIGPSTWSPAHVFADNALYCQLVLGDKIEYLEAKMGMRCDRWPDYVDVSVKGERSFGCDRRVWQADVFSRFVLRTEAFTAAMVVDWLAERYPGERPFPNSDKVAVYYYLQELVDREFIAQGRAQAYRVTHQNPLDTLASFAWNSTCRLSASQLRSLSARAGLRIPIDFVQELLDSFNDVHPAGTVESFVKMLAYRLHAPPRCVLTLLCDAQLVVENRNVQTVAQASLF
ncbi:hypothetical protein F6X40_09600 [Paraburkholderia sp. UCT31]|uniref:DUF7828 domain-containing protein n=1 Tax=Paraburkholderia sp. UCT31 TaxID=2615209 RepID=UPI001654D400|nr:hypothetical protein [Paraburkholderia sp. UCT31]MBC8737062.1 hypothetical protein [Paraburkholderia sp. UCT31]